MCSALEVDWQDFQASGRGSGEAPDVLHHAHLETRSFEIKRSYGLEEVEHGNHNRKLDDLIRRKPQKLLSAIAGSVCSSPSCCFRPCPESDELQQYLHKRALTSATSC